MQFGSKKRLLCLVVCALPALTALAAGVTPETRHLASENPISFGYILQILLSFVAVIAFIFGFAWLMRRSGRFGAAGGRGLRIVSSLSLGMREKIVVVKVGDTSLVVGVAPGQIRTLHVMEGDASLPEAPPAGKGGGFGPVLGRFMKQ